MTKREAFAAAAKARILIKDGPYGTEIQRAKLSPEDYAGDTGLNHDQKGNNDLVNLTQPQVIRKICDSYIDAGAHILATNTFNANRISQADYGAEGLVRDINVSAARIIRAQFSWSDRSADSQNAATPRLRCCSTASKGQSTKRSRSVSLTNTARSSRFSAGWPPSIYSSARL